ncbi:Gfo/Idh/MocA family protein [Paenibacillus gorillae]|uniref:Gfo/Idh/MocA family protein n=1 Tax=Paenibacillus gorillae TaxID=1243662 RepID=UPI0004B26C6B|nr:Gfo/Idh/MocA family oxidoreductase [Paenibacillus gorillae]
MSTIQGRAVRTAVIGYGGAFNIAKMHADHMLQNGMEFIAVCEMNEERLNQALQDFPGIRGYATVEELLAQPDIDLVTVITPHNSHYSLGMQVLESGKHCVLEKPMSITAEEGDALVRKAKEKDVMLSVFHNRRWDSWYLTAKQLIAEGRLGDIFAVELYTGGHGHPGHWWRADKSISGGVAYDWGAHYIDWLLGLVPSRMTTVRGFTHKLKWHDVTNEDHMDIFIGFENGTSASLSVSSLAYAPKPNRRILGTKGAIISNGDEEVILYEDVDGKRVETKVASIPSSWISYYRNITAHLTQGEELVVKPEESRRIIAVLDTAGRSAAEGKELPVPFE